MTAKPNMLARTLPPPITTQPLGEFGEVVVRNMEQRLKLSLTDEARTLFQLPLRKRGLGFCPRFPGRLCDQLPRLYLQQHFQGWSRLGEKRRWVAAVSNSRLFA